METIVKTHIGAYGIVIDNNKIALIRKARGGYKGKLDLPGGGIEHLETPEEALKRELIEEGNIDIKDFHLFNVTSVNIKWLMPNNVYEDLHHIGVLYLVTPSNDELKADADGLDSEGCAWYEIEKIKKEELSPFTIYALEKLGYLLK